MSSLSSSQITVDHISVVRNERTILNDIIWEIFENQSWVVTGPNGAGKSVLLQVLQGRLPSSKGGIRYAGGLRERMADVSFELHHRLVAREQDREILWEFSGCRDGELTVQRLLEDGLNDKSRQEENLDRIVRTIGLDRLRQAPVTTLSNGEMRKTLIARALLDSPRILILDEPYDGLDASACQQLTDILNQLPEMGVQIILATHHMDEIPAIVTHMLRLDAHGHVAYQGEVTRDELVEFKDKLTQPPSSSGSEIRLDDAPVAPADSAASPTIVMSDVTIVYDGRVILNKLNWVVRRNENWALTGPNGAGKSTLLSLVSADNPQAYANEISLFGKPRNGGGESIWDIKRRIGVLSPEFQIRYRENIQVTDIVLSGYFDSIGLYRRASAAQRQSARNWLAFLGIDELADCGYNSLSYGQKRLALLARALVKSPQLLLLDEPCQGLDSDNRRRLLRTVSRVSRDAGVQVIFVTHRLDEIPDTISHTLEFRKTETGGYKAHPHAHL